MATDIIEFNRKFKSHPDHNTREYEFHKDYDIGTYRTCSENLSEEAMKIAFADEVDFMIPKEFQDKITYICKPIMEPNRGIPFCCAWKYPGKSLCA